jgi:hypothetical protein
MPQNKSQGTPFTPGEKTSVDHWASFALNSGRAYNLSSVWYLGVGDVLQPDRNGNGSKEHSMMVSYRSSGTPYFTYHSSNRYRRSLNLVLQDRASPHNDILRLADMKGLRSFAQKAGFFIFILAMLGGCSQQSDPEPSRLDAYVAEYVGLLNASDVTGLSGLLNLPGYPTDAQFRVNAMGGKAWTLQGLDKSELTVGVFDLYISVGSPTAGPQTWTEHVVWGSDGRWSMIPLEATVRARTTPARGPTP